MDLEESERLALYGMRAVHINGDGYEVFVGLSHEESDEFLPLNRQYEAGNEWSPDRRSRFLQLRTKHEDVRQAIIQGLATPS